MKKKFKRLLESGVMMKIILPLILVIILGFIGFASFKKTGAKNLSSEEAQVAAESFINEYLMSPGTKATVKITSEEYDLYKLSVDIGSDVVDSYFSKDGKLFFPQAFNIEEMTKEPVAGDEASSQPVAQAPKSDKPVVELFVMSHCPYGTQIEKGMLPVVAALGDKIDFEIKFVDYAMHGEVELKEQMLQYCVQKEQNDKFNNYLTCFLQDGNSEACIASTSINKTKLNSCVAATDKEFKITENFKNKIGFQGSYPGFDIHKEDNTKYSVGGSPTLVINGADISSGRDSANLLATICGAFNEAPEECSQQLSSATPAPGFGAGTTNNAAAAECN